MAHERSRSSSAPFALGAAAFLAACNAISGVDGYSLQGGDGGKLADSSVKRDSGADVERGESAAPLSIRIRCGIFGAAPFVDSPGATWVNDEDFSPATETDRNTVMVTGTPDPLLYKNERWADRTTYPVGFTYTFDVPSGAYAVKLHFGEINTDFGNQPVGVGYREFNVAINGAPVLTNFDIVASCGWGTACVRTFSARVSGAAPLVVQFSPGQAQNPKVDDIEIVSSSLDGG